MYVANCEPFRPSSAKFPGIFWLTRILPTSSFLQPLFDIVHTKPGPGKSTFWAGTGFVVHRLAAMNANYVTLENTFPAVALDRTTFCPTTAPAPPIDLVPSTTIAAPDFNDTQPAPLPPYSAPTGQSSTIRSVTSQGRSWEHDKPCFGYTPSNVTVSPTPLLPNATFYDFADAYGSWWQAASIRFAREAVGTVNIVYEVDREGPTFCPGEYFGSVELPALNTSMVTTMKVMIATHPDNVVERCDSGSFVLLRKMAEAHFANASNFRFTCADDPFDLTMVRCVRSNQNDAFCRKLITKGWPCPSLPPVSAPINPSVVPSQPPTAPSPPSTIPIMVAPSTQPSSTSPKPLPTPAPAQCSANCLPKTTFKFAVLGASLTAFLAGVLTAVVVQTIIGRYKTSRLNKHNLSPSSSMKDIGYTSLLEDNLNDA